MFALAFEEKFLYLIVMREVCLKIKGRVQGIGYRRWAERKALEIGGISGWVLNMPDGSVEILMKGEEPQVEAMIAACYQGPWAARVDSIDFLPRPSSGFLPPIEDGVFEHI